MMYDVVIIGAGVSGAAIARELSRYDCNVCVLEKEEDVCCGTSKANSAIVHAGYDCKPGSMMAKMNVRGNAMMEQLSKDLDFPFRRNGSLVLCVDEEQLPDLKRLYEQGIQDGVPVTAAAGPRRGACDGAESFGQCRGCFVRAERGYRLPVSDEYCHGRECF